MRLFLKLITDERQILPKSRLRHPRVARAGAASHRHRYVRHIFLRVVYWTVFHILGSPTVRYSEIHTDSRYRVRRLAVREHLASDIGAS